MSEDSLRDLLAQVHAKLADAGSVDAESRSLLVTLARDIERTLAPAASTAPTPPARLNDSRLEALAVRFEAEHPGLARTLRQLIDTLGKAGI